MNPTKSQKFIQKKQLEDSWDLYQYQAICDHLNLLYTKNVLEVAQDLPTTEDNHEAKKRKHESDD
jgi:hypothetical protein